jgi:hypothetical protein
MTDKATLLALAERVEAEEHSSYDGSLYRAFGDEWTHAWDAWCMGSVDAALALMKAVLKDDWRLELVQAGALDEPDFGPWHALLWEAPYHQDGYVVGCNAPTPARAIVAATLRAKAQEVEG